MSLLQSLPHLCTIRRRKNAGTATSGDAYGGPKHSRVEEQTDVPCWEQALSSTEQLKYDKMGVTANRKIYFTTNPNITDRSEIIITQRNGVDIDEADQVVIDGLTAADPDAGAGLGRLFRVMGNVTPGGNT
jgi:hypothetical protein